jgi:hypothetical protein
MDELRKIYERRGVKKVFYPEHRGTKRGSEMPWLKPVDRKGVFYAVGTVGCQRIRKSLGTRDKRQAAELCAQYEAILWKRRSYGEEAVRTFEEAAVSYMEAGGERTYIRPLISRFRGRLLGTIKPEEVRQAARVLVRKKVIDLNRQIIVPMR